MKLNLWIVSTESKIADLANMRKATPNRRDFLPVSRDGPN